MLRRILRAFERPLEVGPRTVHEIDVRDAIVVLGAPLAPDGRLSAIAGERVRAAAELFRAGGAPVVVVTGGMTARGDRAESDVMAEALRALDVHALITERTSRTTRENAAGCVELHVGSRVWLVTQPFHERRAARVFRAAGFDVRVWPIAETVQYREPRRALKWVAREYAAWVKELVRR